MVLYQRKKDARVKRTPVMEVESGGAEGTGA